MNDTTSETEMRGLRAGVSDFVDPTVAPQEVKDVVQRLLDLPAGGGRMDGSRR
ncbi:hypothetical protein GH893_31860, partial [Bacillus thuringiensis]|nr:hypothetical protein [Bacillus thuringiensis]